jgi:hypothetical protein
MPISTKLAVCHNRRISSNKVFLGKARRGKNSTGWFYGFKLFLVVNGIARFGAITILLFNGLLMTAGFIIVISFPFVFLASVGFSLIGLGSSIIVPIVYSPAGKSLRMSAGYACLNHYGWLYRLSIISINYRTLSDRFGMQTAFGVLITMSLSASILAIGLIGNWWLGDTLVANLD